MEDRPSRRRFMQKTTQWALGLTALPHAAFAIHHKKELVGEVVGHGDFRYRVDKNWGIQDPSYIPVKNCHEMVKDRRGRLFLLTNHTKNNIIIYGKTGRVLDTWGTEFPGAHGLTICDDGLEECLFITDTDRHQVFKTTLSGRILMTLDYPAESGAYSISSEYHPTEVAIGPNGDLYVADGYGKNFIVVYDQNGRYKYHFGGHGQGEAQFDCCHGITIDDRDPDHPCLLVSSQNSQSFKRFTLEGEFLESIDVPGCSICRPVIHRKQLYFAVIRTKSWWEYDGLVLIFDEDYQLISAPGGQEVNDCREGLVEVSYDGNTFMNPHDVCLDDDENLYVPQWFSGNTYPVRLLRM